MSCQATIKITEAVKTTKIDVVFGKCPPPAQIKLLFLHLPISIVTRITQNSVRGVWRSLIGQRMSDCDWLRENDDDDVGSNKQLLYGARGPSQKPVKGSPENSSVVAWGYYSEKSETIVLETYSLLT